MTILLSCTNLVSKQFLKSAPKEAKRITVINFLLTLHPYNPMLGFHCNPSKQKLSSLIVQECFIRLWNEGSINYALSTNDEDQGNNASSKLMIQGDSLQLLNCKQKHESPTDLHKNWKNIMIRNYFPYPQSRGTQRQLFSWKITS